MSQCDCFGFEPVPLFGGAQNYDFWSSYQASVRGMIDDDRASVAANASITEVQRAAMLNDLDHTWMLFESIFSESEHNK